jgi:hypothetical protein
MLVPKMFPNFTGNQPGHTHFWAGLMVTKKYFFLLRSFCTKGSLENHFLEDSYHGNKFRKEQYPALYNSARNKSDTITEVLELGTSPQAVSFRQDLIPM